MPFLAPGDLERAGLPGDGITITNPLVAEESVLRTSLLPGLLKAIRHNVSHRNDDIALFEIGHVFRRPIDPGAELPDERETFAVAIAGRRRRPRPSRRGARVCDGFVHGRRRRRQRGDARTPPDPLRRRPGGR